MGLVRLFLALVVAADHWRIIKLVPLSIQLEDQIKLGFNAGYAVMFFYVVSGFLITYTLTRNYDRNLAGTLKFYKNRFLQDLLSLLAAGYPGVSADQSGVDVFLTASLTETS